MVSYPFLVNGKILQCRRWTKGKNKIDCSAVKPMSNNLTLLSQHDPLQLHSLVMQELEISTKFYSLFSHINMQIHSVFLNQMMELEELLMVNSQHKAITWYPGSKHWFITKSIHEFFILWASIALLLFSSQCMESLKKAPWNGHYGSVRPWRMIVSWTHPTPLYSNWTMKTNTSKWVEVATEL